MPAALALLLLDFFTCPWCFFIGAGVLVAGLDGALVEAVVAVVEAGFPCAAEGVAAIGFDFATALAAPAEAGAVWCVTAGFAAVVVAGLVTGFVL